MTTPTFDQQRYERLKETISEYLDDSDGTSSKFLEDLERALLENSQYFVSRVDHYTTLRDFFS